MAGFAGWVQDEENPKVGYIVYDDGTSSTPIYDPDGSQRRSIEESAKMRPPQEPPASVVEPQETPLPVASEAISPMGDLPIGGPQGISKVPAPFVPQVKPVPPPVMYQVVPTQAPVPSIVPPKATDAGVPAPYAPAPPGLLPGKYEVEGVDPVQKEQAKQGLDQANQNYINALEQAGTVNQIVGERRKAYLQGLIDKNLKQEDQLRNDIATKQRIIDNTQKQVESIGAERIDPGRFLTNGDPESNWPWIALATIGTFIGGLNARKRNRPNEFSAMMDRYMNDEIEMQTKNKGTRLQIYQNKLGDANSAQQLLKNDMRQSVIDRLEMEKQRELTQDQVDQIDTTLALERAKLGQDTEKFWTGLIDRNRTTYVAPKPTGPAATPLNADAKEYKDIFDRWGVDDKRMAKYNAARIKSGYDGIMDKTNMAINIIKDKSGGKQDVPGVGSFDGSEIMKMWNKATGSGDDDSKVQSILGFTKADYIKAMSGAAVTDSERKILDRNLEGRGTLDDLIFGIQFMQRGAQKELETINGSFPSEAGAHEEIRGYQQKKRKLSEEALKNKAAQNQPDDRRVIGKDSAGKPFYESPEAKTKRERAESAETARKNKGRSDMEKVFGQFQIPAPKPIKLEDVKR